MFIIAYNVAKGKGYPDKDARLWVFGTILSGIIAILIILSMPKLNEDKQIIVSNHIGTSSTKLPDRTIDLFQQKNINHRPQNNEAFFGFSIISVTEVLKTSSHLL